LRLGEAQAATLRPLLDLYDRASRPTGLSPRALLERHAQAGPDGVLVMLGALVHRAGAGCTGAAHVTIGDFLAEVEDDCPGLVVVADMEAGLEHLSWAGGTLRSADLLLVVVDVTIKVLLTAARTTALARQLGIPEVAFVGNRVRPGDEVRLQEFAAAQGGVLLGALPDDDAVVAADRVGTSLLEHAPSAPSVTALDRLTDTLARRLAPRDAL